MWGLNRSVQSVRGKAWNVLRAVQVLVGVVILFSL